MRLGFFEKVTITNSRKFPEMNGRGGVVTGISEEDGHVFGYAISFEGDGEGYYFAASEVVGTGQFVDRSLFYDNADRIRVRVDKDGRGSIVDPDET